MNNKICNTDVYPDISNVVKKTNLEPQKTTAFYNFTQDEIIYVHDYEYIGTVIHMDERMIDDLKLKNIKESKSFCYDSNLPSQCTDSSSQSNNRLKQYLPIIEQSESPESPRLSQKNTYAQMLSTQSTANQINTYDSNPKSMLLFPSLSNNSLRVKSPINSEPVISSEPNVSLSLPAVKSKHSVKKLFNFYPIFKK